MQQAFGIYRSGPSFGERGHRLIGCPSCAESGAMSDVPLIVEDLLVEAEGAAFLGEDLVLAGELWAAAVELLRGGS